MVWLNVNGTITTATRRFDGDRAAVRQQTLAWACARLNAPLQTPRLHPANSTESHPDKHRQRRPGGTCSRRAAGSMPPHSGGDRMHPNAQTLQRFYTAFSQLDHATMAACYAPDATFEDEAFSLKGREQIGGMWRMLAAPPKSPPPKHWKLEYSGIEADANGGRAHTGGALPLQRYRSHGAQHHRRHLHLHT